MKKLQLLAVLGLVGLAIYLIQNRRAKPTKPTLPTKPTIPTKKPVPESPSVSGRETVSAN